MGQFNTVVTKQAEATKSMYGDMVGTSQRIPLDFEWNGFLKRNTGVLIDPDAPTRSVQNITFPNQNHRATQPLIAGSLDRKSKLQMGRHKTSYYAVTPSKYLHEFSTDDDYAKDPTPELSLFLPDCTVGAIQGEKFAVRGKDMSKNMIGIKGITTHEYSFRAHTAVDAGKWWSVIRAAAGQVTQEPPGEGDESVPTSPVDTMKTGSGSSAAPTTATTTAATPEQSSPAVETPNITDVEKSMSPIEATTADGDTAEDAPAAVPETEHAQNTS